MILIINGPNLNLLGRRQPEIYGSQSFDDYLDELKAAFPDREIIYFQSNCEGEIIDTLQQFGFDPECEGIVINPGAYAHYSFAIADALACIEKIIVEVHVSNILAREEFRHTSVTAAHATAVISGMGLHGYRQALQFIFHKS